MATAGEIVNNALALIGYLEAETPVEAVDLQKGITTLDRMLSSWESGIVQLGYTPVSQSNDELTVPDDALDAIEQKLAIKLAPIFSVPLDQLLIANANEAFDIMLVANRPQMSAQYSNTLPRGSGNDSGFISNDKFYDNDGGPNF